MRASAEAGDTAFQGHLDQGHDRLYTRDIAYILDARDVIEAAL